MSKYKKALNVCLALWGGACWTFSALAFYFLWHGAPVNILGPLACAGVGLLCWANIKS